MNYAIVLRREAEIELDEIFVWYEVQKLGLGFDFIREFEKALEKIISNPNYSSFVFDDARSATLKPVSL